MRRAPPATKSGHAAGIEAFADTAELRAHSIQRVRFKATKADSKAVLICRPAVETTLAGTSY